MLRNVWTKAEVTWISSLLKENCGNHSYARIQLRTSFQNSRRRPRRPIAESNPLEQVQIESGSLHVRGLVKPLIFTVGVSTASLAGCVIWEYENLRSHATNIFKRPNSWLNNHQKRLYSQFKSEPGPVRKWWNSLREAEKVFYPILAVNAVVFAAWRIRPLQPIMVKYFCSNPSGSAQCIPMVLSTFSHYSALHLAANMYVLYSFMPVGASLGNVVLMDARGWQSHTHGKIQYGVVGSAAVAALGKEQFVAMYMCGGVVSSFVSFLYKVALNQPGLSLGASGAIMSVLSFVCVQYPDTKLSIIFLPMYTFAAGTAIKAIMGVDLAGVVFGWKFFDHAAHLGGALFGLAWCYWGGTHIWGNRDKFLQYYHTLRKSDTGR